MKLILRIRPKFSRLRVTNAETSKIEAELNYQGLFVSI
jgi:hypothetical protein